MNSDFDAKWRELAEEVMSGMKEWRLQHPKATLREIEQALDERLGKMRARMLQDAALASAAADIQAAQAEERPVCPKCRAVLQARGTPERRLTTHHNQLVRLERSYGVCPTCGEGFFPPGRGTAVVAGAVDAESTGGPGAAGCLDAICAGGAGVAAFQVRRRIQADGGTPD